MRRIAAVALGTVVFLGILTVPSQAQSADAPGGGTVGDSLNWVLNTSNNALMGQLAYNAPATNFQFEVLAGKTAKLAEVLGDV
ncbi:hypothetical protein O1L44_29510 [Streptomyces noursei]|uniref:hypothetical protein n=1 Tax=Streptomyces noursei TaxID=1971 RepID=UPI00081C6361|nr:membrane protein [Streptomyces noursei ATCC 11455]MCZ0996302.1 hypothetical protein [Streptomyces noursei]